MMDYVTKGAELLAATQGFRARIVSQRNEIEASRRLPGRSRPRASAYRFFRIFLPAAYGGFDMTPMDGIAVFEELAKADASVAWCVWNGNTHWTAAQLLPEAAHVIHHDPKSSPPTGRAPRVGRMSSRTVTA